MNAYNRLINNLETLGLNRLGENISTYLDMIAEGSRSADNNGVAGKVDIVYNNKGKRIEPYPAGCITVALGGSLGSTYLQKEPFYTSQNVSVLEFPDNVSDAAKLFLCTLIYNESFQVLPFYEVWHGKVLLLFQLIRIGFRSDLCLNN